jgi:16S rRNA processing protein RimM
MVVHPTSDSMDDQQRLIPFVEGGVVKQVDPSVGVVIVDWEPDY